MNMVDFTIFKGDNWKYLLTIKENGVAVPLTGYKFYMTLKSDNNNADADADIKKEFDPSDAAAGEVLPELTSEETNALAVSSSTTKYFYDIRMKDSSGEDQVLIFGEFIIKQPTTRTTSIS